MRYPQVIVYESGGRLAAMIKRVAADSRWIVRECRRPDSCRELLKEGRPTVFLLNLESNLVDGLSLLESSAATDPDAAIILVSDVKLEGADQRDQISAMAFDLGASYVLFPPLQQPVVEDIVVGLMDAVCARVIGAVVDDAP